MTSRTPFSVEKRGRPMLKEMKTQTHLKPGQNGTKRLVERFGDSLLCVRYRYDQSRGVWLKTVEIVVEEKEFKSSLKYRDEDIVPIIVAYSENVLRDKLKSAGGRWNPTTKTWLVPYGSVRGTELEERILKDWSMGESVRTPYMRCQRQEGMVPYIGNKLLIYGTGYLYKQLSLTGQ